MKQFFLTICLLLVASTLVSGGYDQQEEGTKKELKDEDWMPIYNKIYATGGEYVGHEKLLELLKELQQIFEPFTEEGTNLPKSEINKLIEVSTRDAQKCSRSYLRELHDFVDDNLSFGASVWPYLNHHFYEYVSFCEKHVLHTNVAGIKDEYQIGIKHLANFLTTIEVDGRVIKDLNTVPSSSNHLREGILAYMERDGDEKLDVDSSYKFSVLFKTKVIDMCKAWIEATDPARALNEFFVGVDFDADEATWLDYGTLCHTIEMSESGLVPIMYRRVKKLNSAPRFKRLKSKVKKLVCLDCGVTE